jgi:Bacterial Ig-like domain
MIMTNPTAWLVPTLMTVLTACPLFCADGPQASEEVQQIEDRQVRVRSHKEITINARGIDENDVKSRELWYSAFDGAKWGEWQKHGIAFAKEQPVTWSPSEGHWKIYFRKTLTSGFAQDVPSAGTKGLAEFVIDRTAPVVAIEFPASKAKLRGGFKYTVKWSATDKYLKNEPITIRWSRDGKGSWDIIAQAIPNTGSYEWTTPRDMTTAGQLQVLAADKAGNIGNLESTSVLIDSVNPSGQVTGPAISAKHDVNLSVQVGDVGPAGLSTARLWVSQDDGSSWVEGPFIADPFTSVGWKATIDGKFRFAVVATDQSGNVTPTPKGKADDQFVVTVDSTAPTIQLSSAIGIVEADKATSSRRAFKPGDRVAVPFALKDANLAANSVIVAWQTDPAKPWIELGKGLPTDSAFRFEIPAVATKSARVRVSATDTAGNLGETVSGETFEIQTAVQVDTIEIK